MDEKCLCTILNAFSSWWMFYEVELRETGIKCTTFGSQIHIHTYMYVEQSIFVFTIPFYYYYLCLFGCLLQENERSKDVIIDHRFHKQIIGTKGEKIREIRDRFNGVQVHT